MPDSEAVREAREVLISESAPWDWQSSDWLAALDALLAAIRADERKRYEAVVDYVEWGDFQHYDGCLGRYKEDSCKCGAVEARAALAALDEEAADD